MYGRVPEVYNGVLVLYSPPRERGIEGMGLFSEGISGSEDGRGVRTTFNETSLEAGSGNSGGGEKGSSMSMGGSARSPSRVLVALSAVFVGGRPVLV